jgi:putative Holliday junction resolvase
VTAPGRLLGVDYGTVRVGLAVSDPDRKIAFPLTTYTRRGRDADAAWFREIVAQESVSGLVVGLPVHTTGREGQKAVEARAFGTWLAEVTGQQVFFYDERFTTVLAESALWEAGLTHKKRKALPRPGGGPDALAGLSRRGLPDRCGARTVGVISTR